MLRRPEPPTGVTAEADRIAGGQARVSWQPPTVTGGSPITRYTVSWTGAGSGSKECTSSPCTITGLSNGKDYSFTVTATNAVGTSAPSAPFGPVRPDTKPGAPAAPRMATRGDGSLGIGWPAAPNTGSPISKYTVRVVSSAGGVKTATTTGAVLTATVSGLVNNDTQSVSVQAWNGAGAGPFGATATMQSAGTPPALPAPGIDHTGAGPGVDTSSVTLTWPAADPNGPAITAYTIHRRVAGGAWAVLSTAGSDARSAKDTVAFDGQRYDYAVTATNGAGKTSAMSAPAGFVANGYPDAPSISAVDNGPTKQARLTVTLGKARSGGYGRIDWRSSSGASGSYPCGSGCPVGQGIAITTGELPLGDQTFTATAVNSAGNTATSGASGAVSPYGPTPAPANGRSSVNAQNVTYGWDLPTNGRPVDAVQLIGPRGATHDLGAGATSWSYTGAWSSDATVRVRAHSAAGWSGYLTIGATIGAAPPPPPPPPAPKPTISNVWKGPVTTVTIGSCTSGSCYRIDYSGSGIPDGTYTLACYVDNGTSPFFTTTGATVRGGQPTYDHYCALGGWRTNARIVLTGNGKTIDSGWHPWQ
ncbi:MAG: fibronectin type III domain-containing protein [Micrococcales bacterium]|nr:fibronectin type III domain-containing protein [Micrococcales bacterium]